MASKIGCINLRGKNTIIWNFAGAKLETNFKSEWIYVPECSRVVFFHVVMKNNIDPALVLLETHHGTVTIYDVRIMLKYDGKKEEIAVKNSVPSYTDDFFQHDLANIKVTDLLEITCSFLKVEIRTGIEADIRVASLINILKNAFLNEEDSDVMIKVGDLKYPAHKLIIRARSSVFDKMLKHDMVEKNHGVIDIPDCDPYVFRDFLLYIYTGKLDNLKNENVFELYHISDKYDVKELRIECVDFIMNNLTMETFCDAIIHGVRHHELSLITRATEFFIENAKEIILSAKWQNFVKQHPVEANDLFVTFVTEYTD